MRDNPDLDDAIVRLQAFEAVGADVLYAPRLTSLDEVRAIRAAVSKPINVLAIPGVSFEDTVTAGGQRVSVGGKLCLYAVEQFARVAEEMRRGDFASLTASPPLGDWLG